MRVLVAEDDSVTAELLANALGEFGYEVTVAEDGCEAFQRIRSGHYRLVVSDWEMPGMSGLELCRKIRRRQSSGYVYVILITSHGGVANVVEGLDAGADDFLTKPFNPQELRVRLRVGQRLLSLESRDLTIFAMAKLAESRDTETGAHLERIREYSRLLAEELSQRREYRDWVDGDYAQLLYLTSPLHDIGKVGIPDRVLLKPGRLTPEEFEIMKQHTVFGGNTLEAAARAHPEARFLTMAMDIALTHHERFDGTGYPRGLCGREIPLCGRIVALADVYDALTSRRVYKPAYSHEKTRSIILEGRGSHFDPDMVDAFLACEDQFVKIQRQFADEGPGGAVPTPLLDIPAGATEGCSIGS
ncbi:MAG: response regulator [Pirellulales bacterium]|nr:response regulator [Pirellulales bacterium]